MIEFIDQMQLVARDSSDPLQPWAELSTKQAEEHRGTAASARLNLGMFNFYI
jgi:hypothetical protein